MKKFELTFMLFLTLSLTFLALSYTIQFEARAAEQPIFEDDFESYNIGAFPAGDGWQLWYSGMGSAHQVIVEGVSSSPTKSLQLLGDYSRNWAAYAANPIATDSPLIGFSVSVRVESLGDGDRDVARVGFAKLVPPNHAKSYAPILFSDFGTIRVMGEDDDLQSYVADRWYKVTVIMDRKTETYSLWIDYVLVGENLTVMTNIGSMTDVDTWEIEAFAVSQNYHSTKVYFDDVSIFSVFEADPKLELEPTSGIAQTTLVGSGFAPNSEISVTWNGTTIHTVPNPLITNGQGNFTAIITVPNQTISGQYLVTAVDEMNNEATASFEVISPFLTSIIDDNSTIHVNVDPELGLEPTSTITWSLLLVMVPAVLAVSVIYVRITRNSKPERRTQ